MARYHINAAGDAGLCRARTRPCPFGGEPDHYKSLEEARSVFENQQELLAWIGVGSPLPLSPAAETALHADLEPLEDQPSWIDDYTSRLQQELFGVTPQVIATVDSPLGPLAVVWEAATVESNDLTSEVDQGYRIARISYRSMDDGELLGYVKAAHMDADSLAASYGSDEWRGFRYLRDRESFYAMSNPEEDERPFIPRDYSPDQSADDFQSTSLAIEPPPLESREQLADFVAKAQRHLGVQSSIRPQSMGIEELREELARVQGAAAERLDSYGAGFSTPYIDYVKLSREELRGQGLGASLYIFMARKQAEQGRALQASDLQTQEAQKSWARMAADPRLPVKVTNTAYLMRGVRSVKAGYMLDFRGQ